MSLSTRVRLDSKRGTIRYIGPLPDSSKTWAGVEWDRLGEGKHSGEGLFVCSDLKGSFVRLDKLQFAQELGVACVQRYGVGPRRVRMGILGLEGSAVGERNGGRMGEKEIVQTMSRGSGMSEVNGSSEHEVGGSLDPGVLQKLEGPIDPVPQGAGPDVEMQKNRSVDATPVAADNIETVNVSDTLFSSWNDLLELIQEVLPNCKELIANDDAPFLCMPGKVSTLAKLHTLVLNGSVPEMSDGVETSEHPLDGLNKLTRAPALRSIHLASNGWTKIPSGLKHFAGAGESLNHIDLSLNSFALLEFDAILSKLPSNTTSLNLGGNVKLRVTLESPKDSFEVTHTLPKMQICTLDRTLIKELDEIETLNCYFPNLKELRLLDTPFFENSTKQIIDPTRRCRVIGRMPCLTRLNGTEISARERVDAEIFCLKSTESLARRQELQQIHAVDVETQLVRVERKPISINFLLHRTGGMQQSASRSLPGMTSVRDLFIVYEHLFGVLLREVLDDDDDEDNELNELCMMYDRKMTTIFRNERIRLIDVLPEHCLEASVFNKLV